MGKGEKIYDIGGGEGERHRHKDITLYKDKKKTVARLGSVLWARAYKFEVGSKKLGADLIFIT